MTPSIQFDSPPIDPPTYPTNEPPDIQKMDGRKVDVQEGDHLPYFHPNFFLGVATCTYQDSGSFHCPNSQWASWENHCLPKENRSGKSANLFALYQTKSGRKALIERLQKLGVNSYRFSVEWSHIQPEKDQFDIANLNIYVTLCQELKQAGIEPMVTLHHFSEPKWFHRLGSFEKEENIPYFVAFSTKVFTALTQPYQDEPLTRFFCTFNEPGIEAFSRYIRGSFSPGFLCHFQQAGYFLKNMLKAHSATYQALKQIEQRAQIGFTHQRLILKGTNPLIDFILGPINLLVNKLTLDVFRNQAFDYKTPFFHIHEEMELPTDFIGLQYYTVAVIGWTGPTSYGEPMTQMPFREYPEGLYEAILEVHSACHAPLFITENGISTHDEQQRARYLERALYITYLAQKKIGDPNYSGLFSLVFLR